MDIVFAVAVIAGVAAGALISYLSFREGLRVGMKAAQGVSPQPVEGPEKAARRRKAESAKAKQDKEELDRIAQGLRNIAEYNPIKTAGDAK